MSKLLRAGLRRYIHSIVFWLAIIAAAVVAFDAGRRARAYAVDDFCILCLFLICAVVSVWIIGREAAEGGFRNQVIVGHTKGRIFLSELLLGTGFSLLVAVIFFGIFFAVNSYVFSCFPAELILMMVLDCLLSGMFFTAIVVACCCLIPNRIASAIVCILLVFAVVLGTAEIEHALLQPEYYESYSSMAEPWTDEEGQIHYESHIIEDSIQRTANPNYVADPLRTVYQIAYNISPCGHISHYTVFTYEWFGYDYSTPLDTQSWEEQAKQISGEISGADYENVAFNLLHSVALWVGAGLIGYLVFRKKELK